jgi:hypothetical protein
MAYTLRVSLHHQEDSMKPFFFFLSITVGLIFPADSKERFGYTIAMKTANSGTSYVDATLAESITASFLVDTGSAMLVINQTTFKALKQSNHVQFSHEAAARLANGKLHRVDVYTVPQFRIGQRCDIGPVEVAVIKKGNNILGMSVLKRAAPFALSIVPPTLMLSECSDVLAPHLTASK